MRKRQDALLLAWGLFSLAGGAGAEKAPSRSGAKAAAPTTHAAPKASRAPVKPILLLDEKNLGLGCAQS